MKGDMTQGNIPKQLLLFTLPIMAGNFLQQFYNTVDGIVVGNFANQAHSLAAVGTCGTATIFLVSLAIGLSAGGTILTSQLFGAKRMDEMRRSVSTFLILLTAVGLAVSALTAIFSRWMLRVALGVDDAVLPLAVTYLAIYSIGLTFTFIYNAVASLLRALGNSRCSLYFLLVSSVTNIVLDLLFVVVFKWGVAGTAIATVISQLLCAAVSVWYLFVKTPDFVPDRKHFVFDRRDCATMLKLSIPTTIQNLAVSGGGVALQRLVNTFGPLNMEAYAASHKLEYMVMVPLNSFCTGVTSFTAQNMGAQRIDRVKKGHLASILMSLGSTILVCGVTYIWAPQLIALFGVSSEALPIGVEHLRYLMLPMLLFSVYLQTNALLRGAGDVMRSSFTTLLSLAVRVFGAYIFASKVGYSAAWFFQPYGWYLCFTIVWIIYLRGKWKQKVLI